MKHAKIALPGHIMVGETIKKESKKRRSRGRRLKDLQEQESLQGGMIAESYPMRRDIFDGVTDAIAAVDRQLEDRVKAKLREQGLIEWPEAAS